MNAAWWPRMISTALSVAPAARASDAACIRRISSPDTALPAIQMMKLTSALLAAATAATMAPSEWPSRPTRAASIPARSRDR